MLPRQAAHPGSIPGGSFAPLPNYPDPSDGSGPEKARHGARGCRITNERMSLTDKPTPTRDAHVGENGEAELVGQPKGGVSKIPAGRLCNGKKTDDDGNFGGYCNMWAGTGTEEDAGRCKHHGGLAGPAEGNQNATTHALRADPKNYAGALDDDEATWVEEMSEVVLDRLREQKGDVDPLDRALAHRVVVKLHIVAHASEYVVSEGIVQEILTDEGQIVVENRVLDSLRRYDGEIVQELKTLGLLNDPDTKKADALAEWKSYLSGERPGQEAGQE